MTAIGGDQSSERLLLYDRLQSEKSLEIQYEILENRAPCPAINCPIDTIGICALNMCTLAGMMGLRVDI